MSYMRRFLRRHQYEITKEKYQGLIKKYPFLLKSGSDLLLNDSRTESTHRKTTQPIQELIVSIHTEDWKDVSFLIHAQTDFFIADVAEKGFENEARLVVKEEGLRFEVIRQINPDNHPWLDRIIEPGEILTLTKKPHYGTIDTVSGFPADMDGGATQINYDYVKLAK